LAGSALRSGFPCTQAAAGHRQAYRPHTSPTNTVSAYPIGQLSFAHQAIRKYGFECRSRRAPRDRRRGGVRVQDTEVLGGQPYTPAPSPPHSAAQRPTHFAPFCCSGVPLDIAWSVPNRGSHGDLAAQTTKDTHECPSDSLTKGRVPGSLERSKAKYPDPSSAGS
jgi:hypothetical protein